MKNIPFIVPAYKPEFQMIEVIQSLIKHTNSAIYIVDDGSPDKTIFKNEVFQNKRVRLLTHAVNLGKGASLKTAMNAILVDNPDTIGCVTLDADGQHSTEDAVAIQQTLSQNTGLIIGSREINLNDDTIPFRSRFGNVMTRNILKLMTGIALKDTQSGLRGISQELMKDLLQLKSNRYEFEMEMILLSKKIGIPIKTQIIKTVYHGKNESSHFNPLLDSLKIYFVLLRFFGGALSSAAIDIVAFAFLYKIISLGLVYSYFGARAISGIYNYFINKNFVFRENMEIKNSARKYLFLFIFNALVGYYLLNLSLSYGNSVIVQKILIEVLLFFINFFLQRDWIFKKNVWIDDERI